MSRPPSDHWQLQEAKQRFSEVIRAAESHGTQFVTRHGSEVVAIVPIQEYREHADTGDDFVAHLLSFPTVDDDASAVLDEVVAHRAGDIPRDVDLGTGA